MKVITIGRMNVRMSNHRHILEVDENKFLDELPLPLFEGVRFDSLDASDYQGANIIQDMNLPLLPGNSSYVACYDCVLDGGSLEHFYNIPEVMNTYNLLLKTGGYIYIITNANNHFGHGLYQFSSELFYRVFSEQAGYKVIDCFLEEHPFLDARIGTRRDFFDAPDPAVAGRRTQFVNARPVMIHFLAQKVSDCKLAESVVQADYARVWKSEMGMRKIGWRRVVLAWLSVVPMWWLPFNAIFLKRPFRLGRSGLFPRRKR